MRRPDGGFTLIEVLVTTVILGIIVYPLTEAVILALKTTGTTASSVSGAVAIRTLNSFYYGDVNSATTVATSGTGCMTADPDVFLHLTWPVAQNPAVNTDVSYALDPDQAGSGSTLVRIDCTGGGGANVRTLGHLDYDPQKQVVCQTRDTMSNMLTPAPCGSTTAAVTLTLDSKANANPNTLFALTQTP